MTGELRQCIDRALVDFALALRLALEKRTHTVVAEILKQEKPLLAVDSKRTRRQKTPIQKMAATVRNGPRSSCWGGASISTAVSSPR
jgi:hypothetical protein